MGLTRLNPRELLYEVWISGLPPFDQAIALHLDLDWQARYASGEWEIEDLNNALTSAIHGTVTPLYGNTREWS